MSVLTIATCDRCREAVSQDRHVLAVTTGSLRTRHPTIDLCVGCLAALLAWLDDAAPCPATELATEGTDPR